MTSRLLGWLIPCSELRSKLEKLLRVVSFSLPKEHIFWLSKEIVGISSWCRRFPFVQCCSVSVVMERQKTVKSFSFIQHVLALSMYS